MAEPIHIDLMIPNMGWVNTQLAMTLPHWLKNFNVRLTMPTNLKPLSYARNWCVEQFLQSEAQYLWLLDDDVAPPAYALHRLLEADKPVVAGLVHQLKVDDDGILKPAPMLLRRDEQGEFRVAQGAGIARIDRAGFACVLFQRSVFETIPKPWFETRPVGEIRGTDFIFCEKMERAGIPLWGHFDVECPQLVEVYI
jgi:hypothetical protein